MGLFEVDRHRSVPQPCLNSIWAWSEIGGDGVTPLHKHENLLDATCDQAPVAL